MLVHQMGRPHHDRLGRQVPHQMGVPPFLKVMALNAPPGAIRVVPFQKVQLESGLSPTVDCPCDPTRLVEVPEGTMVKCGNCERHYISDGRKVWVVYGDMERPPLPPPDDVPVTD